MRLEQSDAGMAPVAAAMSGLVVFGIGLLFYFLPTFVAFNRRHRNLVPIFLLNFLLGWTFVAWVVTLAWSFSDDVRSRLRQA